MEVINKITPIELNGKPLEVGHNFRILVVSDWVWKDRVHLKFMDLDLTLSADELRRAIDNACNHK